MLFFFFFQAEDGIRDYKVTGVQTCALPISAMRRGSWITPVACKRSCAAKRDGSAAPIHGAKARLKAIERENFPASRAHGRSGERRVGEECRSRWAPDH